MKVITTILALSVLACGATLADVKESRSESKTSKSTKTDSDSDSSTASASISSSTKDGKGTVSYNDKEVWKGKVKKQLSALTKAEDGKECAAAFDGKKVVWELNKGDGKKLEPELKKLLKKLPKI